MPDAENVRVSTVVDVDPETAFRVFTEDIDVWWRRDPRYRVAGRPGSIRFEPLGAGGLLVNFHDEDGGEPYPFGRVLVWEPGERLVFEWRARAFDPDQVTEVEILFAPQGNGTRVSLEHRGWDSIPAEQPARHGLVGEAFVSMMGLWWADLLVAMRERAKAAKESTQ